MEEVFPPYHVFINHRGPDVKRTLASLIYHRLEGHGLRVFLDKHELQAGDSLTPAIKSAICSASVQIAIFSKTYAQSAWCLNELLWMFDSRSSIIIPIFYDIQPSDLRHVDQGAYAGAFQQHREKGRVTIQQLESWISALNKVSAISGVVISTEEDDLGERLEEIVEIILKEVRREDLDVGKYPVGLRQAAEHFEREVLNPSEISGIKVVGIVGLGGSGKSTLKLGFQDTLRGRSMLRDRLRGLKRVLIVFDDMANTEQVENLLFVKDVVGNGSLILVTSRDQTLFVSSNIEIYNIKLLDSENAQELFYWHAFGHSEPVDDLQNMVEELVGMCSGFPLALKVLAGQFHNEHDPGKWKKELDSLRKQLPNNILKQIVKDSYKSLDIREREAFLDIAHFLNGEDVDLAEKVLDGLNGSGTQCLRTLRRKCLVEYESADIILPTTIRAEFVSWRRGVWRRAKGSLKVRMHDLVRDLARQIGREELPLRFCCRKHTVVPRHVSDWQFIKKESPGKKILLWFSRIRPGSREGRLPLFGVPGAVKGSRNKFDVRGIRRDDENCLKWNGFTLKDIAGKTAWHPFFQVMRIQQATRRILDDCKWLNRDDDDQLPYENIYGLKLLALQNSSLLQRLNSVSGDLIWLRLRRSKDTPTPILSRRGISNLIPYTILLKILRVLEVHDVNNRDFINSFYDREPLLHLQELTVTCTSDSQMYNPWTAGPSTAGFRKLKLASKISDSLRHPIPSKAVSTKLSSVSNAPDLFQSQINIGHWLWEWLGKQKWKNLVKLILQNIEDMMTLPFKFEEVRNLRHVDLSGCTNLKVLPDCFTEELLQLQYLALRDCRNLILRNLGKISTLEYLDCEGCSMLNELPEGMEAQKSLKHLNVLRTELTKLPQHLEQLENLEELLIGSSKLIELPSSLYTLSRLTDLALLGCTKLFYIDNSIEKLVHLERFRIYNCGLKALPERIAWMNMKISDVQDCPLGSNHLVIGVDSANISPDSSQVQRNIDHGAHHNCSSCLTDLIIRDSQILKIDIPRAESLFPKLEIVDLSSNIYLREIGRLPGSLITLNLTNCSELRTLACLSNLAGLKVLDISGCIELETLNVEGLNSMEVIKADMCWKLQSIQGLGQLQKLSYFQISVDSLPRSSCTDFLTCAPNISTAVLSGKSMKMEAVDKMDRVARRFEGIKVRSSLESAQLERTVKLKGAIFLYLITDQDCNIEVTFFGHVYTAHSSRFEYPVHILMWTKDSEVYKDFKSSSDKARDFSWLKTPIKKGWIVQAENSEVCKRFISYLFVEGYI
ncbi:disease resistance protein RPP2B-like [Cryptomeria japonica]|uniref:disease resistance protein RPP2B-like n=1 Tax=Cryptomeria japonica TaxID=3369 RepID=UPI0027DA1CCF|nr:disease resistance protein RPP2B-like [Cryptomeria japonica]